MNGIIKNEFFPKRIYQNHKEAKKAIERIVLTYNNSRPHSSLDYMTPNKAHDTIGVLKKRYLRNNKSRNAVNQYIWRLCLHIDILLK